MQSSTSRSYYVAVWGVFSAVLCFLVLILLSANDQAIVYRTLTLGVFASLLAVPLGGSMAWVASGRGIVAATVRLFCFVAVLLPVFVHVTAWDAAFGKLGLLTSSFGDVLKPIVARWPAAIWIHGMIAAPQVAIIFLVAIFNGRPSWEDALRLEAKPLTVNTRILLWRFLPVAAAASLWTIVSCAREIGVTDIYQIGTLAEQVYLGYSLGQLNAIGNAWTPDQLLAAQNLGMGVSGLVVAWLAASAMCVFFAMLRSVSFSESQRMTVRQDRGLVPRITGVAILFVVVFIPVFNLIGRVGFSVARVNGKPVAGWSLASAIEAVQNVVLNFQDEFIWSLLIAFFSATIVSAIAMLLAFWFWRSVYIKLLLIVMFGLLAATPGPSIGLFVAGVFSQFEWPWLTYLYDRTIVAPVVANVLFSLPFAMPLFLFLASQISEDQQQFATVDGVSSGLQFVQFSVVGGWRSNLGGWFLVAALSFGELSATQMVLPPGMDTVPRLALGMLHAGVNESTAALTLVTLCPVILFGLLAQFCFAAKRRLRVE